MVKDIQQLQDIVAVTQEDVRTTHFLLNNTAPFRGNVYLEEGPILKTANEVKQDLIDELARVRHAFSVEKSTLRKAVGKLGQTKTDLRNSLQRSLESINGEIARLKTDEQTEIDRRFDELTRVMFEKLEEYVAIDRLVQTEAKLERSTQQWATTLTNQIGSAKRQIMSSMETRYRQMQNDQSTKLQALENKLTNEIANVKRELQSVSDSRSNSWSPSSRWRSSSRFRLPSQFSRGRYSDSSDSDD